LKISTDELLNLFLLKGNNSNSFVIKNQEYVFKFWKGSAFELEILLSNLLEVSRALSPSGLTPEIKHWVQLDEYLIVIFKYYHFKEFKTNISSIFKAGQILAKAHTLLKDTNNTGKSISWSGFYGQQDEFRALIKNINHKIIFYHSSKLIDLCKKNYRTPMHLLHRDLNPSNIKTVKSKLQIIDWDLSHVGYREDDIAMSLICLLDDVDKNFIKLAEAFFEGYKSVINYEWLGLKDQNIISSIALSGLRQAVSGWYSDKGNTSAYYWEKIMHRIKVSSFLAGC